jgi:SNF2 family DNA or RNA helicase
MTPYEAVREELDFPFELYPFQVESVNELGRYDRAGFYWEPGTGKTAGTTFWCLHKSLTEGIDQWLVIMPPILLLQWERWLKSVKWHHDGESPTVCVYAGTPKQRNAKSLDCDFTLMSYVIFKNDYERLTEHFSGKKVGVVCDEGHAVKNITSQNHKAVRGFAEGRPLAILTGTPLTTPMDAYAYVKLIAPGIYRNMRQFENVHIGEKDQYGTVIKWDNLDLLADNMKVQTSRILRREVQDQLPPITFTTMVYDLAPAHHKLYERIAQEKLVEFEDGREINAISTQALYSALQQVIINWAHFEEDESKEPAALELVDEVFDEIGPTAKLAVVANFIRSNSYLSLKLAKYGAVAVYGEITPSNKQKAIKRFIEDPSCRCILLQPQSAGFGIDGLQHVCSDMLVLEAPTTAPPFYQVTARLDRDGQKNPVNCRIAVANKTVQVRMFKRLLENDATINSIQGGYKDLKDAIYGD